MALANLTEGEKIKTVEERICTAEFADETHNRLIYFLVIQSFLSITAFLGNTLILVALHKESSLHAPSKLLFRTLATTDLCVGIIVEPLVLTASISDVNERWDICHFAYVASHISGYILGSVSLFTLTAISVDRLLALSLGLRYRQVVTLKRTHAIVTVFWVLSIVGTAMYFWSYRITLWYGCTVTSLCIATAFFCYIRIFFALRHNQAQVQHHPHQGQPSQIAPLNTARYRKTVSSALWVQLALVVCYLPNVIVAALTSQRNFTSPLFLASEFAVTLVYFNSSLNPILYCWKIREVRRAVKETVRQICCFCS